MRLPRLRSHSSREPDVLIADPRFEDWETVHTFADRDTAVAWREQLRSLGLQAACVSDHALDRYGRGDIYLVVAPGEWSRANEVVENLE